MGEVTLKRIIGIPLLMVLLYTLWTKLEDTIQTFDEPMVARLLFIVVLLMIGLLVRKILTH